MLFPRDPNAYYGNEALKVLDTMEAPDVAVFDWVISRNKDVASSEQICDILCHYGSVPLFEVAAKNDMDVEDAFFLLSQLLLGKLPKFGHLARRVYEYLNERDVNPHFLKTSFSMRARVRVTVLFPFLFLFLLPFCTPSHLMEILFINPIRSFSQSNSL